MKFVKMVAACAIGSMVATAAFAAEPVRTMKSSKGDILAGLNGMTLYTFKKDEKGVSNCNDDCAKKWPPLMAGDNAKAQGAYSIIKRKDGSQQWAKDGMPLYFWMNDKKSGDITGDGVGGNWDLAKP